MLAAHTETLESRSARLDQLRSELEETHRSTLEMRAAVEEAWAEFAEAAGLDVATERLEAARSAVSVHFRRLQESIEREREELAEAQTRFEQRHAEELTRQESFSQWSAEREGQLRAWDEELRRQAETLESREAAWRSIRDEWQRERLEAETIIRDLLQQLADANLDQPPVDDVEQDGPEVGADSAPGSRWIRGPHAERRRVSS